ncbi:hypothetical protein ACRAWD_27520 [Caulobacter segnis]
MVDRLEESCGTAGRARRTDQAPPPAKIGQAEAAEQLDERLRASPAELGRRRTACS